jgi:group I intron endonuclease
MENSYGIIYCATNSINNKKYIGQTVNTLKQRKREHLSSAKRGDRFSFQKAINKYGKDNFTWEIIDYADNQEELDKKEIYWIEKFNAI